MPQPMIYDICLLTTEISDKNLVASARTYGSGEEAQLSPGRIPFDFLLTRRLEPNNCSRFSVQQSSQVSLR